ncbi:MAG: Cu2+-exporting ATPase, partial [Enterobacterales bacterium]
ASLLKWTSLIFATAVVFYSAQPFFIAAIRDLKNRTIGMDVPVALAIAVAYVASLIATVKGVGAVYYESVTMFCFLLLLGRYFESKVRWKLSRQDQNLAELLPLKCLLKTSTREKLVTPFELKAGDIVVIKAGERVAVDGEVIEGEGLFDESVLTGEFMARRHHCGEAVLAGSILTDGFVKIKVLRTVDKSAVNVILDLMSGTTKHKSTSLDMAHKVATFFVCLILILAILAGYYWWVVDPLRVLPVVVSLLVVSCPCALSLATPVAHTAASIGLREQGILLVESQVLSNIFNVTDVIFDKTGTLTQGKISIKETTCFTSLDESFCSSLAASMEKASAHPIASAFSEFPTFDISDVTVMSGRGITGVYQGQSYVIGSSAHVLDFCSALDKNLLDELNDERRIFLADSKQLLANFSLYDPLKADVASTFTDPWLKSLSRHLLSGDTSTEVQRLAKQLEFDHVLAGVSADEKKQYVSKLSDQGKFSLTLGDGVNDGPVLAASGISIAVAEATSLAQSKSDVVFLNSGVNSLLQLRRMAIKTRMIIRQNYSWALAYNIIAIPVAASDMIVPWIAALGMSLSSLLVLLNATRLLRFSGKPQPSTESSMPSLIESKSGAY